MKINRRQLTRLAVLGAPATAAASQASAAPRVTHGPFLGHVTSSSVHVWGRTAQEGSLQVRYGIDPAKLDRVSDPVRTSPDHDNAAWMEIKGLRSNTRYYYRLEGGGEAGTFRTLPEPADYRDAETNPLGLFNFSFAFGSCANQKPGGGMGPELPAYKTLNRQHASKVLFSVMNGDWLYEEKREYPVEEWRRQLSVTPGSEPTIVKQSPSITGVWENYKLYLERGVPLAKWHRDVPGYFTPDDHEILNDVYGTGTPGTRTREAVFRDIAMRAWYDYIAGSNPLATSQGIHFGEATVKGDVLIDLKADFSRLRLEEASNLHIHWGGQLAGTLPSRNAGEGNPNAGVYAIEGIEDANRLRIRPAPRGGKCTYSIGRHNYGKFRCGNVEVYLLDTRGMRDMHDISHPERPGPLILEGSSTTGSRHRWRQAMRISSFSLPR